MPQSSTPKKSVHYGWYIVAAGTLCIFAGLGFGRFALGMLLPAMGVSLKLTYSQMGLISTSNFVGYLLAVLVCGYLSSRIGSRLLIFLALLLVAVSMLLVSRANSFMTVALFYTLTGMGSGASNVPMMALVASWFSTRQRGKAAGFIVIGSGFAILLSGKLIPYLNQMHEVDGWRINWLVLGIIVLIISVICFLVIRDSPEELGLEPFSGRDTTRQGGHSPFDEGYPSVTKKDIYHLGAIYFLFGYTYVIYATFIVTTLVQERGFSEITSRVTHGIFNPDVRLSIDCTLPARHVSLLFNRLLRDCSLGHTLYYGSPGGRLCWTPENSTGFRFHNFYFCDWTDCRSCSGRLSG
jgi:MFS family permease